MKILSYNEIFDIYNKVYMLKKIYWKKLDEDYFVIIHKLKSEEYRPYSATLFFMGWIEKKERKFITDLYNNSGMDILAACIVVVGAANKDGEIITVEEINNELLRRKKVYDFDWIEEILEMWDLTRLVITPHIDKDDEITDYYSILRFENLGDRRYKIWLPVYEIEIKEENISHNT